MLTWPKIDPIPPVVWKILKIYNEKLGNSGRFEKIYNLRKIYHNSKIRKLENHYPKKHFIGKSI